MLQHCSNWHTTYPVFKRHWHRESEQYAGGDALLTALDQDWDVKETCYVEEYWHAGTRLVTIYHFDLVRDDGETMTMPVLTTPYVRRIIREQQFKVLPLAERDDRVRRTADN